jgi:hypothetical protein
VRQELRFSQRRGFGCLFSLAQPGLGIAQGLLGAPALVELLLGAAV